MLSENSNSALNKSSYQEILAVVVKEGTKKDFLLCEKGVNGLCGNCTSKEGECEVGSVAKEEANNFFEIHNTKNASIGDVIRVGIVEKSLWISIIVSYLIPLLCLLIGMTGSALISLHMVGEIKDGYAIIGSLVGLLIGVTIAWMIANYCVKNVWAPQMLGVLKNIKGCDKNK